MEKSKEPKKWKIAIVIWIAIVPLIFTIMPFFKPRLLALGVSETLTDLILTTVLVVLMVYVAEPLVMKVFGKWVDK